MSQIFVQIASYRDKQLIPTIKDLLQNASNPQNLTFGICWQHDETESLDEYKDDPRFRILDIPYQESRGCCWARNLTQTLYKGETYTMQIDSHMRFIPNWDQECINMIEELKTKRYKKPILTGYPPSFFPEEDPQKRMKFPIRVKFDKFIDQGAVNLKPHKINGWESMTSPVISKYFSAGFYFTIGEFIKEVPYDPELFFRGEEITMTIRAYTHGYDFFHPHKIILWHEYTRKGAPRNHITEATKKSHHRTNVFLGLSGLDQASLDFSIYGLGSERTFSDYEIFSGIDFKNKDASKCIEMEKQT
jgi:glycosyltransferase involved in cell wall biosynthesis